MNADDIVTVELRPGPDGWESRAVTYAEFEQAWTRAHEPSLDPPTTRDLAAMGKPVGSSADALMVVALLRCKHSRVPIGAVLHLGRSGRDPLLLAELRQTNSGRLLSPESAKGGLSTGDRLADLDAVPLDSVLLSAWGGAEIDCPADVGVKHRIEAQCLAEIGWDSHRKMSRQVAAQRGRWPNPRPVNLDDVKPTWSACTIAAMRDDPYGTGDTRSAAVLDEHEHR